MQKNRLEAFSDGVLAIIITIMVLELRAPHEATWEGLKDQLPIFCSYLLSFVYVAIYWNNHHHMLHTVHHVNGPVLWANIHLLFWLSLIPFTTSWMGEHPLSSVTGVVYGFSLLMSAVAYMVLQNTIIRSQGEGSVLRQATGKDFKGKISPVLYIAGILLSLVQPLLGDLMYVLVALMWLIPDRRIEKTLPH
ncbi:TMEM175 family protein [Deinococcus roseus]|uniref:DUF1211 domain-containing protein n=1 Tax=Deinococcus roseus TaxID=392414 RepID=A0ABQ2CZ17_9DEIO|nr:TMEM175 family protein [Deinococcus roseus]GGJ34712.1 hypothetical protein GCM10008938_21130 [Deinococcus roseus]